MSISFDESPLRHISTQRPGDYLAYYREFMEQAAFYSAHPEMCWGAFTAAWWNQLFHETLTSYQNLRAAIESARKERN